MARFNIIRPKRTPNWVLSLLVGGVLMSVMFPLLGILSGM